MLERTKRLLMRSSDKEQADGGNSASSAHLSSPVTQFAIGKHLLLPFTANHCLYFSRCLLKNLQLYKAWNECISNN